MRRPPTRAPRAEAGQAASAPRPRAGPGRVETLKKRAEFRACARALKAHTPSMVVQGRPRPPGEAEGIRLGLTASRKVGKAVARNRARRRLREAARQVLPRRGREGWDYVLIARRDSTVARPFARLVEDLERALARLHAEADR